MPSDTNWYRDPEALQDELRRDQMTAPLPLVIEGYDNLRRLRHGGQGVVYEATQRSTKRRVAIKVLLEGAFASESAQRRFEREIEVIASLSHPNIVNIYDSGTTVDGRPYYVMEYIDGVPLDEFFGGLQSQASPAPQSLDVRATAEAYATPASPGGVPSLPVRTTLALFAKICDAVNFAHQRGVIHRDLKPSNIRIDPAGEPHVLDFGLAKSVTGAFDNGSHMSRTGDFVGSLPWASPEQAEGDPQSIDIRTDVYSLGVVLFQMLTGQFPYEVRGPLTTKPIRSRSSAWRRSPSGATRALAN
jgi:serine/threonine protein kinase